MIPNESFIRFSPDHHIGLAQKKRWTEVPTDHIPHGAHIYDELFDNFSPSYEGDRGMLNIIGGATSERAQHLVDLGFAVHVRDINPNVIKSLKDHHFPAMVQDVSNFGTPELGLFALGQVEFYKTALLEGILCNLIGPDLFRGLQTTDMMLRPGGKIYIADIMHASEEHSALREYLGISKYKEYVRSWRERYDTSKRAGLPNDSFLVMRPGIFKNDELSPHAPFIKALYDSSKHERLARHIKISNLNRIVRRLGLTTRYFEETIFYSRNGDPLAGFFIVLEKPDIYKYHPLYSGKRLEETPWLRLQYNELRRVDENYYYEKIVEGIRRNFPKRFWKGLF